MRNKILMTLALLLTAVTGAWADETPIVTITATGSGPAYSVEGIVTLETGGASYTDVNGWNSGSPINLTVTAADGVTITKVKFFGNKGSSWEDTESPFQVLLQNYYVKNTFGINIGPDDGVKSIEVYGTIAPAEPAINVTPVTGKTNEWTFTMPAFDVEIAPIYAPVAQWAKVEDVDQLPTAAEGIFAESTDSIITPGKVAKIGETEDLQGEVKYFATGDKNMTAEKAAKADGWLSKLPTAAGYERDTTIYVWYYIKGADTPTDEEATAENTFNDSEICAEPIEVKILSNKFDIEFKAANANTIETGKATVTVGGTAKTVTEGKLTGVKMGSEVKVKAKDGYKFRKVEAKKGGPKTITIGGSYSATLDIEGCTTWQQVVEKNSTLITIFVEDFITDPDTYQFLMKGNKYVAPGDNIDPTATDYTFVNASF